MLAYIFLFSNNDPVGPKHVADWLVIIMSASLQALISFDLCEINI